jgi:hypothetical protein
VDEGGLSLPGSGGGPECVKTTYPPREPAPSSSYIWRHSFHSAPRVNLSKSHDEDSFQS